MGKSFSTIMEIMGNHAAARQGWRKPDGVYGYPFIIKISSIHHQHTPGLREAAEDMDLYKSDEPGFVKFQPAPGKGICGDDACWGGRVVKISERKPCPYGSLEIYEPTDADKKATDWFC